MPLRNLYITTQPAAMVTNYLFSLVTVAKEQEQEFFITSNLYNFSFSRLKNNRLDTLDIV